MTECLHLRPPTGMTSPCGSCSKPGILLKLYGCARFGQCTPARQVPGVPCCATCEYREETGGDREVQFSAPAPADIQVPAPVVAPPLPAPYLPQKVESAPRPSKVRWAYGITTVPERRSTYLPRTISSLRSAGFDRPRLFVDGCSHRVAIQYEEEFRLPVSAHDPHLRLAANWTSALLELFSRQPTADRYAIFQDDLAACKSVRPYLDRQRMPDRGYWNLHCFLDNDDPAVHRSQTWFEGGIIKRNTPTTKQTGRSALALVFSREGVITLLSSRRFMERPSTVNGHLLVDGGIVSAMNELEWREWVHRPSLFLHTGDISTTGHQSYPPAQSFPGEDFDALSLIQSPAAVQSMV